MIIVSTLLHWITVFKYHVTFLVMSQLVESIDIESLQNRLLKVCHVPATSAGLNKLLLFHFFAAAISRTNEANKAGSMRH